MIFFRVNGIPRPQPRPRATIRGAHAGVYDPGTANAWRNAVKLAAVAVLPDKPLDGPLSVDLEILLPRPKRLMRKKDPEGEVWATGKLNDVDNLAKAIMDALTNARVWEDDGQVVSLAVRKKYHAKECEPGALILIRPEVELRGWREPMSSRRM